MQATANKWIRTIVLRLALCLVLAIATTIAIAWAFSRGGTGVGTQVWNAVQMPTPDERHDAVRVIHLYKTGAWFWAAQAMPAEAGPMGSEPVPSLEALTPRDVRPLLLPWIGRGENWPTARSFVIRHVYAFGWPAPSLAGAIRLEPGTATTFPGFWQLPALRTSGDALPGLPVHILPLGFALDSILSAGLWALILFAPPAVRRARRRRRGLCPRCAYDLRATGGPTSGCPECGWNRLSLPRLAPIDASSTTQD